jgi:DNA repair exonuclease SbcCD ATPase subunit
MIGLDARNVKRLTAVELRFDPGEGLVIVSGPNGAGKSSVLDAIAFALGGEKLIPEKPIREGAQWAEVTVTLDGADLPGAPWQVTRRFTRSGSSLRVTSTTGDMRSPQTMLNALLGRWAFDPAAFARASASDQRAALLSLAEGLEDTLTECAAERDRLYGERRDVNREVKRLEGAVESAGELPADTPSEPLDTAALMAQLAEAEAAHQQHKAMAQRLLDLGAEVQGLREQLDARERELAALHEGFASEQGAPLKQSVDALRGQIASAAEINQAVESQRLRGELLADLQRQREISDALTAALEQCDERRDAALKAAALPVEGLGIDDTGVLWNGLPFAQASQSEQLRVSMAIAMAANPDLRLLHVDAGSLLDKQSLALLAEIASAHDYTVLVERVSDPGEGVGIVLEDGAVVADQREGGSHE